MKLQQIKELVDSSNSNIREIICEVLHLQHIDYILKDQQINVSAQEKQQIMGYIQQLNDGLPLAYILNYKYFWDDRFYVNQNVLIPRNDSELLVEKVLDKYGINFEGSFIELGVGSGCIGLSILKHRKKLKLLGCDISKAAIDVAEFNKAALGLEERAAFIQSKWLESYLDHDVRVDFIVSNPPYIAHGDTRVENQVKQYEPHIALYADENGMACYREILLQVSSSNILKSKGLIFFEIGIGMQEQITNLANEYNFRVISTYKDLANIERVLILQKI